MRSPRNGSPNLRQALRSAFALCGLLPLVGCQAEYAGMHLPSGKYLHDDVQYLAPGPHFKWANTQAASQRARMELMGIDEEEAAPAKSPVAKKPTGGGGLGAGAGGASMPPAAPTTNEPKADADKADADKAKADDVPATDAKKPADPPKESARPRDNSPF